MSADPSVAVLDFLYIPLFGLYLTHYLISRGFRTNRLFVREEKRWGFSVRSHELIIRTFLYLIMSNILFWHVLGRASIVVALGVAATTLAVDYWRMYHFHSLTITTRLFIGRHAIVQLIYTLLFLTVACVAYSLRVEGVLPK